MKESDILYQNGPFWVCKARKGYEVYATVGTHSVRRFIAGSEGEKWLARAIAEADKRADATK